MWAFFVHHVVHLLHYFRHENHLVNGMGVLLHAQSERNLLLTRNCLIFETLFVYLVNAYAFKECR
jgi:hypothetical protein